MKWFETPSLEQLVLKDLEELRVRCRVLEEQAVWRDAEIVDLDKFKALELNSAENGIETPFWREVTKRWFSGLTKRHGTDVALTVGSVWYIPWDPARPGDDRTTPLLLNHGVRP